MINIIAIEISTMISKYIELDKIKEAELTYFLKRMIKNIIFYVVLFTIATILNITWSVFVLLLSYHCVRLRFGGVHLKNQTLCMVFSIILPLIFGYIALIFKFDLYCLIGLYTLIFLYSNYVGVIDNINRPLTVKKKQLFKKQGLIIILTLFVLNVIIYKLNFVIISNSILMGVLLGTILLIRIPNKLKE